MISIFKAENYKIKHTVVNKLVWLAPLIMVLSCYLMNRTYLYSISMVWWYTILVFIVTALTCSLCNQKENRKLQYRNVYQMPISLSKIWRAKIYMIAYKTILSSNFLWLFLCILSYLTMGDVENGVLVTLLAVNIIWILSIWLIPIYIIVAKKTGFYIPFLLGGIFCIIGIFMYAVEKWWTIPVAWADRIMCTVIGYLPNGIHTTGEDSKLLLSKGSIGIVLVAAITLFFLLTFLSSFLFDRGHKKC